MSLTTGLARTLLLMRDEVGEAVSDDTLLAALTSTRVALVADAGNLASHAAQSSFVTAAMLMARSGHQVHLLGRDLPLAGPQPPLPPGNLITTLMVVGNDLLPGVGFTTNVPVERIDLAVAFGDAAIPIAARRVIRLNADAWTGRIVPPGEAAPFGARWWPVGGMAAGALAAGEAFKIAMHKLGPLFRNPARLHSVFAASDAVAIVLAPEGTPYARELGVFDSVSGGAIMQAALYALARVPGITGRARVIEPDRGDLTNLNRYMLLLRSHLGEPKATDLAAMLADSGLILTPLKMRFEAGTLDGILPLAPSVLVGVDDIPSRWLVQRQQPEWLAVGATTHWSAMASFHQAGLGCAECLHRVDEPGNGPIPTVAFVSFWAGLCTVAYFLRRAAGYPLGQQEQQVFMTPFRIENAMRAPVPFRVRCPTCAALAYRAAS
jgi:hypothetical protein